MSPPRSWTSGSGAKVNRSTASSATSGSGRTKSSTGRSVTAFLEDYERAARGEYDGWREEPESCLALVILLDQFPRNLFRNYPQALYATDDKALDISRAAVQKGFDQKPPPFQRHFLYMPFMHSEDLEDQQRSVALFRELATEEGGPDVTEYAEGHRDIIERFGRFPHRNEVLGRETTPEEAEFLEQPGSSF